MKLSFNIIFKFSSLILIIFYILVFIYINLGIDKDYEYYSKKYKDCLKNNEAIERAKSPQEETFPWFDEEEIPSLLYEENDYQDCEDYNKDFIYFVSCLIIYVYIILNIIIKCSQFINGNKIPCQILLNIAILILYLFYLCVGNFKRPKTGHIKFIIMIIDVLINIIFMIPHIYIARNEHGKENVKYDCLDLFSKINNDKTKERINNEISSIEKINNLLKKENKKLLKLKKRRVSYNIEDKKIEVILWYVEKTYNKKFSPDIIYKYFLEEIKNNFSQIIDTNQFEKIFLSYIKEKFEECLKCPITFDIFKNPVITPEGQTYDNYEIIKVLEKQGVNPLSKKELTEEQLINNILVKKLCVIITENKDELTKNNFNKIKKFLINPENKKFYSNPVVIKEGDKKGETEEGIGLIKEYSNKVILNIIEQNKEILSDEFFEDKNENNINNKNNGINLNYNQDTLNTVTRLNININSKYI